MEAHASSLFFEEIDVPAVLQAQLLWIPVQSAALLLQTRLGSFGLGDMPIWSTAPQLWTGWFWTDRVSKDITISSSYCCGRQKVLSLDDLLMWRIVGFRFLCSNNNPSIGSMQSITPSTLVTPYHYYWPFFFALLDNLAFLFVISLNFIACTTWAIPYSFSFFEFRIRTLRTEEAGDRGQVSAVLL